MEKVIRNGKVAVLYSPGMGIGWYTWNMNQKLLFHPKLVKIVEEGNQGKITKEWIQENLGIDDIDCRGACNLKIEWLLSGTLFAVEEYDGSESIKTESDLIIIA